MDVYIYIYISMHVCMHTFICSTVCSTTDVALGQARLQHDKFSTFIYTVSFPEREGERIICVCICIFYIYIHVYIYLHFNIYIYIYTTYMCVYMNMPQHGICDMVVTCAYKCWTRCSPDGQAYKKQ